MNRPLWRIFLNVLLLAFVAQRGGMLAMAVLAHARVLLITAILLQCIAGLIAAIAIWVGRFMQGSLIALGATIVVAAVIEVSALGAAALPGALAQIMAGLISVAGLIFLLRHMPEGE